MKTTKLLFEMERDANRYRWLRAKYAAGEETYLAEGIFTEGALDEYIDRRVIEGIGLVEDDGK